MPLALQNGVFGSVALGLHSRISGYDLHSSCATEPDALRFVQILSGSLFQYTIVIIQTPLMARVQAVYAFFTTCPS